MQQRLIHLLLTVGVFVYILFEEIVWETIARPIYDYIHSLRLLQKIEARVHRLPAWVLLALFLVIFIKVELLGLLAGWMLVKGHAFTAVTLYATKVPIAAFAFWLFRISKDKLLTIGWFKTSYTFVMRQIDRIKSSEIYRQIKTKTAAIKARIKQFKATYLPKGELKRRARRIYLHLKKLFKKDLS